MANHNIFEEYALRGEGLPYDMMRQHQLPDILCPRRGKVGRGGQAGWAGVLPALPEAAIVKYGKLEHLQLMLDYGHVRLCPASYYKDESLGPHRHDDERVRTTFQHPQGSSVRLVQRADGTPVPDSPKMPIRGNITHRVETWDYGSFPNFVPVRVRESG